MTDHETSIGKAIEVYRLLLDAYGKPQWELGDDPVDVLIGTILSANTNDVNSGRAFDQLKAAFNDDWDAVRLAPLSDIIGAIRPAGMYHQKAPAIVAALEKIKADRGSYSLRQVCQAQKPRCELCSIQHLCNYFNDAREWQADV